MESVIIHEGLNLKETELRLGLPGSDKSEKETISSSRNNKRAVSDTVDDRESVSDDKYENAPPPKAQVVGWPPIRSYRKNCFQPKKIDTETGTYVKVSMDGAPYLRKVDLRVYKCYPELLEALENMFKLTVSTLRGKVIKDPNTHPLMKIKMVTGCWLEMFRGTCLCHPAKD